MTAAATTTGNKPPCDRDDALAVLTRLREAGHVAYFAGGCVRDELLGLTPKDYDVATDAPPDRVRQLFSNTQAVGAAFGVILVRHRKSVVEVATFRTDGKYVDGRRPTEVTFTTAEEDAKRRDFTINGLFLDPIENRVIDYVGGQEDLKNRVLRAIGDPNHRFEEDHLRLLRAVRFAARFDLDIEERTHAAIKAHAPQIVRISPERIAEELRIMLTPPTRVVAWRLLWRLDIIKEIFRFSRAGDHSPDPEMPYYFDSVWPLKTIPFSVALTAADLCFRWRTSPPGTAVRELVGAKQARETIRAMRQGLRTSNAENEQMEEMLTALGTLLNGPYPSVAVKKRFAATPTQGGTRALLRALSHLGWYRERADRLEAELSVLEPADYAPPPLITGDDLTDAGLTPGPKFKVALDQTYDAQLEDRITTRKEALEMAIGIVRGPSA
ncbi:MAG: CCA tRNA nucleotidyltransferase [Tepidisphaeraceae bacterium]